VDPRSRPARLAHRHSRQPYPRPSRRVGSRALERCSDGRPLKARCHQHVGSA
jgi:hypothetical protein